VIGKANFSGHGANRLGARTIAAKIGKGPNKATMEEGWRTDDRRGGKGKAKAALPGWGRGRWWRRV
jgi:hypothetical protein